jgi:hypothetical protein
MMDNNYITCEGWWHPKGGEGGKMKTPIERYHSDAQFANLVEMMINHIINAHYTPSEMRDAAIMASIIYESRYNHDGRIMANQDVRNFLDGVEFKKEAK